METNSKEVLCACDLCHVFRLPPKDYLVSDKWEGNHIWSGRVLVIRELPASSGGTSVALSRSYIQLEDPETAKVFGVCPLPRSNTTDPKEKQSFQFATDSSRSFVIRIQQGEQQAYLGINFENKTDAFRFSTALLERDKKEERMVETLRTTDHSLGSGEKIRIDLSGKVKSSTPSDAAVGGGRGGVPGSVGGGAGGLSLSGLSTGLPNQTGSSRRVRLGESSAGCSSSSSATSVPVSQRVSVHQHPQRSPAQRTTPQDAEKPKVNLDDLF